MNTTVKPMRNKCLHTNIVCTMDGLDLLELYRMLVQVVLKIQGYPIYGLGQRETLKVSILSCSGTLCNS